MPGKFSYYYKNSEEWIPLPESLEQLVNSMLGDHNSITFRRLCVKEEDDAENIITSTDYEPVVYSEG